MESYSQAPVLKHNGEKFQSPHGWGKAIRTHELEAAIFRCLGPKDYAMAKIMLFLTGNADGFRVSEKTIMERCNISETGYKKARKKLAEMGWIFHKPSDYIQVNFNKVFSDYKNARLGYLQETEEKVNVDALSKPSEVSSELKTGASQDKNGIPEDTHNNINNNISNNIKNIRDKGDRSENTCFVADATPQVFSEPLREAKYSWDEIKEAKRKFEKWRQDTYDSMMCLFDEDEYEAIAAMKESEEYKNFEKQCEEKRNALKEKYGDLIRI